MSKDSSFMGARIVPRLTINYLVLPNPTVRIFLRGTAFLLLMVVTMLNYHVRNLPAQIIIDFLYLIPITVAAMNSFIDGLVTALAAGYLRLFINPVTFSFLKATDYVDLIIVLGFYLLDPVLVELLRRLARQRRQLGQNLYITTAALLEALHLRDQYTGRHSRQVAGYARRLAAALDLPRDYQESLYLAGLLHDIGKIGINDACLNKPGRLTPEEWQAIRRHPQLSYNIVKKVDKIEEGIARAVLYHHERYDGRGYPQGLKGEAIPLEARILSVADCYDAMTTNRVYRPALTPVEAVRELKRCAGSQFDPQIVDVFCRILAADGLNQDHKDKAHDLC
ncbi:HD-GYP domain-containing protein [Moorella naiadis]|uniref:HD-GYP domain-containing protein n=1 Tax=Moorella naiadis (nom. illeg.) TaxID=3093670 RepID=UPI003D9CACE9